jgi:hypothetical protein
MVTHENKINESIVYTIKHLSDEEISNKSGTYFNLNTNTTINSNTNENDQWIYIGNDINKENTIDKIIIYKPNRVDILAILWKKAISNELCDLAVNKYMNAGKMVSTNRGNAAGNTHRNTKTNAKNRFEKSSASNSAIIGYIDSLNHKRPCRLTSFSKDYYQEYKDGLKFIEAIDNCFKICLPDIHLKQHTECRNNSSNYQIENTAFSTVTINYNFQTALHKDSGDYKDGFGNLVVCNKNIQGGELLFPQYKVAISLETGDFLAMDVHEWHCNNKIHYNHSLNLDEDAYRLSFVCYYRENMSQCDKINKNILSLTGNLNCKQWDTNIIFNKIFESIGITKLPEKVIIEDGKPWWSMTAERFTLIYRYKRYILKDTFTKQTIHNLIPAYNYAINIKNNGDKVRIDTGINTWINTWINTGIDNIIKDE